eukprot:scaffold30926_cov62-Phaeocystis_antarctica.AAC.3
MPREEKARVFSIPHQVRAVCHPVPPQSWRSYFAYKCHPANVLRPYLVPTIGHGHEVQAGQGHLPLRLSLLELRLQRGNPSTACTHLASHKASTSSSGVRPASSRALASASAARSRRDHSATLCSAEHPCSAEQWIADSPSSSSVSSARVVPLDEKESSSVAPSSVAP